MNQTVYSMRLKRSKIHLYDGITYCHRNTKFSRQTPIPVRIIISILDISSYQTTDLIAIYYIYEFKLPLKYQSLYQHQGATAGLWTVRPGFNSWFRTRECISPTRQIFCNIKLMAYHVLALLAMVSMFSLSLVSN